ncbi:hypothetical protein CR207_12950 [Chromobacterium violaceum]|uniref:hemagglutinin repeat-containing protein n=1 Tax=Chromobacterium violaceum TaxID=536 RepID=UPI000C12504A|nr:hemagglutinin repeat-containing protein [Chromobacterium violaceum]ATP33137.1 hypothetical protein CR207_12950 [Chromobacterium violaceum]
MAAERAQLQANRNLSISASGNLVNNGQLQSSGNLSLSGVNWTNNGSVNIGGTLSTQLSQNGAEYRRHAEQPRWRLVIQPGRYADRPIRRGGGAGGESHRDFAVGWEYVYRSGLRAGGDALLNGASLASGGKGSAEERHSDYSKTVHHSSGWFSSSTTTDIVAHDSTHEAGSTVSADTVILKGQRDINIHASQVAGSGDVTLDAGRNLNITSGTDTSRLFQYHKEETSGLFSGGGLGFTIGSKELMQQMDGAGTTQSQNRSLVGSIGGNLNIKTGDTLTLQGSDVTAGGNLYLDTRKQNLDVAVDTWHSVQKTESRSSGLTVQLTSPLISGVQAMASAADTALKSKDDRVKALSTATAALAGYNSYTAYQQALVSDSHNESGSLLKSGGTLVDLAHGAGQGSIVTGKGAQFVAGKDLTLQAEGDIHLLAAKSTSSEHTTSSSSSAWMATAASTS